MSPEVHHVRQRIEAKIEDLIGLLDILDGDADLEPYLSGFDHPYRGGSPDDREGADDSCMPGLGEGDDSDFEPSIGTCIFRNGRFEVDVEMSDGDEQDYSGDEGDYSAGRLDGGCGL